MLFLNYDFFVMKGKTFVNLDMIEKNQKRRKLF
jgi:hypothetical protein